MTDASQQLYLLTPALDDPEAFRPALAAALGAGPVAAVMIRLAPADERTLVNRVKALTPAIQEAGAAALVADPGGPVDLAHLVARSGADGGHAVDPARLAELRSRFGDERSVGAGGLRTRHDAMSAGEIGVDYVLFGEPDPGGSVPPLPAVLERAAWWAEIFQIPCVAYAPSLASVSELAGTGAEFVALGDVVWSHPDGPAEAVRQALSALTIQPETAS